MKICFSAETIDIMPGDTDRVLAGIFKLDGDKLTVCVSHEPGGNWSTEFSGKESSGQILVELKREKK